MLFAKSCCIVSDLMVTSDFQFFSVSVSAFTSS